MSLGLKEVFLYTDNKCLEQFARICYFCEYTTDSFKNKLDKFWTLEQSGSYL